MILKRSRVKCACVLACVAMSILAACGRGPRRAVQDSRTLRVCYSSLTATQIPLLYAVDQGIFDNYGLEVELFYFDSGTDAVTSLIAGETDLCQVAGSSVVNAAIAGEDMVFLAGLFNTYVYSVIVAPDILEAEDLRGQAVAISRAGSSSDAAIRIALESMGLTPDEDVAVLAIGDQSVRLAALESGQIAGTVISIPESSRAQQLGFRELLDMSTLNAPYQHTAIAASRRFVDAERETVVIFMQGLLEAIRRMKTDRSSTIEVMAEYLQLDPVADAELLSAAYDKLIPTYLPEVPFPSVEGIQTLIDRADGTSPAAADIQAEDLIDQSVIEGALAAMEKE